jgi:peptidyl-prolyl cis-trans isomerase A (cyclophilin A)
MTRTLQNLSNMMHRLLLLISFLCGGAACLIPSTAGAQADSQPSAQTNQTPATTVQHTQVQLATTLGDILLELEDARAPESVKNFLSYVKSGYYDALIFHRVIPNFMIQGGGFDENMIKKATQAPIKNEAKNGLTNRRGSIAMARTSRVDSATSQFFINLVDNKNLDHNVRSFGYAVFGKVISGMDVVDKIAAQPTGRRGVYSDVPKTPIVITSARIITESNKPE